MKYLFAAAAVAVLASSPASAAAKKMMNCSGDGPSKMSTMMMGMPYDQKMMMMQKSQAEMNMAMSKGDMRACNKAMMRAQKM